jgi:thiamine biosynthesis lipoprotein
MTNQISVTQQEGHIQVAFTAMASPCYLLIEGDDVTQHQKLIKHTIKEVERLEQKLSRYVLDSVCTKINLSNGNPVEIDTETYNLFKYAQELYDVSDGLFDITSGALSQVWTFDEDLVTPTQEAIDRVLPYVGWTKMTVTPEAITLPTGMEIDFGAMGKEYAVSCIAKVGRELAPKHSILINIGGDMEISQKRSDGLKWTVDIERHAQEPLRVKFDRGAMATTGDLHRFVMIDGERYSHILNPKTGWPIKQSVSTVTVTAQTCIQAGSIATLALLKGDDTESFLEKQTGIKYVVNPY